MAFGAKHSEDDEFMTSAWQRGRAVEVPVEELRVCARREDEAPPVGIDDNSDSEGEESPPPSPQEETRAGSRDREEVSFVPHQITQDPKLYLKWGWVRMEDIQPLLDMMEDQDIVQLGMVKLLGQEFQSLSVVTHCGKVEGTDVTISRQAKIDGPSEDNFDLASFAFEILHSELATIRRHLKLTKHVRYMETFIGVPLTAILIR
ncbi:hypothetical protein R1sor_019737 [Riccia sorocarpa]|uniref:Uncharacterized protein n=1 Tax=Riccia sorocarpa TaxID=122646 RepID=A0ABD3IDD2_9MARC